MKRGETVQGASVIDSGLSKFPKTTLQYEGDDDEDAVLFFLEIRKYGQPGNGISHTMHLEVLPRFR